MNADAYSGEYGEEKLEVYAPENALSGNAKVFGHGGSDFYSMYNFIEKILGNQNADTIDI